jgi:hypothetical protein
LLLVVVAVTLEKSTLAVEAVLVDFVQQLRQLVVVGHLNHLLN